MILLWGLLEDAPLRSVHDHLCRLNADVAFASYAAIGHTSVRLTAGPDFSYLLACDGSSYLLEEMTAAYLRPHDPRDYTDGTATARAHVLHSLIHDWADWSAATVINRPSADATNHSKLWQAMRIAESGFSIPESLVTNDREQIRELHARHGSLIFKSMSSIRSVVQRLDLSALDALEALGPVLVQQEVVGRNVRVHVVRDRTFACAVETEGVDYRYAPSSISPVALPDDVATRCIALTRRLGLVISGIDLIVTDAGDWYCLEVNPNPAFSHYDLWDGEIIARTVAETLLE